MAHILIDGYNLIGTAHDSLEKARNELIVKLQRYASLKNHHITLVFDGWKRGNKEHSLMKSRGMTVMFTRLGDTADSAIRGMLASQAQSWIVVSSDREVADWALRNGCAAIRSDDFEIRMEEALRKGSAEEDTGNSSGLRSRPAQSSWKGTPKKLSKKDRMIIQALRKL